MKNKTPVKIIVIAFVTVTVAISMIACAARFVFLSPSCFSDNDDLTDRENYFIKKIVLEEIENRLSVFGENGKNIFIWIDTNFMESVTQENGEYIIRVQTYYMEAYSDDCVYEIHLSEDFDVTFFGLDA